MTIETSVEQAEDVFQDAQWPLFNREKAMKMVSPLPKLGVLSFVATELNLPRDMALLDAACATLAESLVFSNLRLGSSKTWLFAANDAWLPRSSVSAYKAARKKLWKSFPIDWQIADLRPREELLFESGDGLRFGGLAEVDAETFRVATQVLRKNTSSAIIISSREEIEQEQQVRSLFYSSFPERNGVPQIAVDWMMLALNVCPLGDVVVRVSGSYDERCAAIDCIMQSEQLPLSQNEVSVG